MKAPTLALKDVRLADGPLMLFDGVDIALDARVRAHLSPEMKLRDVLTPQGGDQVMVRGQPRHVISYAKDFLFTESQLRQPVRSLSGGERNRLLLARALATVVNILDPDAIVLGGGLSRMAMLYDRVPELWKRYIFSEPEHIATRLLAPLHGDSSGVRGAAWLWPE